MEKILLMLLLFAITNLMAQSDSSVVKDSTAAETPVATVDESQIVRSILDQAGLPNKNVSDVAVMENGRVVSLDLSNKDVSKEGIKVIPSDIARLTSLRVLICKNNAISVLPPELFNCLQLTKLDLNSNSISELPLEIGRLSNLVEIDARYNKLESIPYTISNLRALQILRLWGNLISTLDESVVELPALKELYLKDNRLTTLPLGLINMKTLTYIDIIGNKICDPDPKLDSWLKSKDKLYKQSQKCW